jgi:hypothetical protein
MQDSDGLIFDDSLSAIVPVHIRCTVPRDYRTVPVHTRCTVPRDYRTVPVHTRCTVPRLPKYREG